MMKRGMTLLLALVLALGLFAGDVWAEATQAPAKEETETQAPEKDAAAEPERNLFAEMEIQTIQGEPFDAKVLDGKPFMLNIWATWCGPCAAEVPALEELYKEYGDRMHIVGLLGDAVRVKDGTTLETKQEEVDDALAMYETLGVTYPSLVPNVLMMALMGQLQVQYFPTTIFFDGTGKPLRFEVGGKDKAGWEQVINEVLDSLKEQK